MMKHIRVKHPKQQGKGENAKKEPISLFSFAARGKLL
jgi:hypothetical protein